MLGINVDQVQQIMADRLGSFTKLLILLTVIWILFRYVHCTDLSVADVDAIISPDEVKRDGSGSIIFYANEVVSLYLLSSSFGNKSDDHDGEIHVSFTTKSAKRGVQCDNFQHTQSFSVDQVIPNEKLAIFKVKFEPFDRDDQYYYICLKEEFRTEEGSWIHQGNTSLVRISVIARTIKTTLLPLWLQVIFLCILLCLSGLFSGLNLGLMALDKTELRIIEKCGSEKEKQYTKVIAPLRQRGNFLLCTLLMGNVLVNNTLTILLDDLTTGLIAVIGATLGIVIFGEIIPQAICSRHGLAVGAKTVFITKFFMILTFILSFPISLLLDKILGEEIGQVYSREKLQALIRMTKDIDDDEVNIIAGALELSKKNVGDIMTLIDDVFMLEYNTPLDFEAMTDIMKRGYTRIPVYEADRNNIQALLNIKDLALLDPDDALPLKSVIDFYQHTVLRVFEDLKLDNMLKNFRQGDSHMAIVQRVNNEGDGDPFYETVGVVTLEDVIEEIIQAEIIDESDIIIDNKRKVPRKGVRPDFSQFNQPDTQNKPRMSPQLNMATFQFLTSSLKFFKEEYISENVLKKLILLNIVLDRADSDNFIYEENVSSHFFVLILEGHVDVVIGSEKMQFDGGPFSYYGLDALDICDNVVFPPGGIESVKPETYVPDFSMKPATDIVYLKLSREFYIAGRRATFIGRSKHLEPTEDEAFHKECNLLANANANANCTDIMEKQKGGKWTICKEAGNRDLNLEHKSFHPAGQDDSADCSFSGASVTNKNTAYTVESERKNSNLHLKDGENIATDPACETEKGQKKSEVDEQIPLMEIRNLNVSVSDIPV